MSTVEERLAARLRDGSFARTARQLIADLRDDGVFLVDWSEARTAIDSLDMASRTVAAVLPVNSLEALPARRRGDCHCAVAGCDHCRRDHRGPDGTCVKCGCRGFL